MTAHDDYAAGDRLQLNPATMADLIRSVDEVPALPEAYLRDRIHLAFLEAVTRLYGRRPRFADAVEARRFGGIPIYLDADVPPNTLELRWPDGRPPVRVDLTPPPPVIDVDSDRLLGLDGDSFPRLIDLAGP